MNNDQEKNSIKDRILNEIKKGDLKMHPKFTYALKAIFMVATIIILIMIVVFLISFMVFSLKNNGAQFLITTGFMGVLYLIYSLPWVFVSVTLFAILLIEYLVKRFKFAYRRPLIYSLLIVLIFSTACGVLMHREFFHRGVSCLINDSLYSPKPVNFPNTYQGQIHKINENEIQIIDLNGRIIDAIFPSESFRLKENEFEPGDRIIFTGNKDDLIINISSYRKLNCGCGGCNLDDL
ncbi:MAG: hypothetical protein V1686_02765 [Patescibacteria group bacterium]